MLDTPSSTLAFVGGAARIANQYLHSKGHGIDYALIEHLDGVLSGLWGAYLFRPTKNNLRHHPDDHAHETFPEAVEGLMNLRQ